MRNIAASVEEVTGKRLDRTRLLYEIAKRLVSSVKGEDAERLLSVYREKMIPHGTPITVTDGFGNERAAISLGVDGDLRLLVEYENGERQALISGDVSIKF